MRNEIEFNNFIIDEDSKENLPSVRFHSKKETPNQSTERLES